MKTHNKIIALQMSVILLLVAFLIGYENLREQEIKLYLISKLASDQNVIDKVLEFKADGYFKPTLDNAAWDGMLQLTQTKDTAWAKENLGGVIITCEMSFLGAFDTAGNKIYSVSDTNSLDFKLTPSQIRNWFKSKNKIHSFIIYKDIIYEIFGAKIVPSWDVYYKSQAHGYLISAKQWNKQFISQIKSATGFNVNVRIHNLKSTKDSTRIITRTIKNNSDKTIAKIEFGKSDQYIKESSMLRNLTIVGFLLMLVVFTLFLYLSNLWLAKPIKSLTQSLETGEMEPIAEMITHKSGFGDIARLINQFYIQKSDLIKEIGIRKEAEEKALESDRLKTAFLANMSHEIRTPMNAILGFSKLLEDDDLEKEEKKEYIDIIKLKGTELINIIDDIIDISKIASGQLALVNSSFNFNYLIQELLQQYEEEKVIKEKENIEILVSTTLPNEKSVIFTDYIRMKQVLNNLLGNALKFTQNGTITFGYEHFNDHINFFVSDTGKGIANDKLSIIFERFRQEEETYTRKFGGTGLGLTISKGLIELMGGDIRVESKEGEGSKFTFTLPFQINNNDSPT